MGFASADASESRQSPPQLDAAATDWQFINLVTHLAHQMINGALVWIVIAIVALAIEATNLNLIFLFGGVAALLAGTLAALGVPIVGQIIGFAVAALILPALLRPRLLRRLGGVGVLSRTDALIGQTARVTSAIDPVVGGRVLVQGHDWAANSTEPIGKGALVEVLGADGIVLLVQPVATLPSGDNN